MIIGSWDVEHADDREKWTDLRTDYIVIRLDFNREEMEQLEKSLKMAKADCESWVTCVIQANEHYTDCELKLLYHYTDKEIRNDKIGHEYPIPFDYFSEDAISFLKDFAYEKLGCHPQFEVLHDDYTHKDWPQEYIFSKAEIAENSNRIIVE